MKSTGYVFKSRDYIGSAEPPATVLEDESRFGNDGTFLADGEPDWVRNAPGLWVMDFDGGDDWVDLGCNPLNPKAGTVLMWVYNKSATGTQTIIYDTGGGYFHSSSSSGGLGKFRFDFYDGAAKRVTGISAHSLNIWHFVVLTWDSSNIEMLVDMVSQGTTGAGAIGDVTNFLDIGGTEGSNGHDGYIIKIKIATFKLPKELQAAIFQNERHWFGV